MPLQALTISTALAVLLVAGMPAMAETCFSVGDHLFAELPAAVLASVVQLVDYADDGTVGSASTGFVVAASSAGHPFGMNRVLTADHAVPLGRDVMVVSSEGREIARAGVERRSGDVAVLSVSVVSENTEWRSIPGLRLAPQRSALGVVASPGAPTPGASGAPVLNSRNAVTSLVTAVLAGRGPDVLVPTGNVWKTRLGDAAFSGFAPLPRAGDVRSVAVPDDLLRILGPDAMAPGPRTRPLRRFVGTVPAFPGSWCVIHQGLFATVGG